MSECVCTSQLQYSNHPLAGGDLVLAKKIPIHHLMHVQGSADLSADRMILLPGRTNFLWVLPGGVSFTR